MILFPRAAAGFEELQVNTYSASQQWEPAIATAPDGSFVVVWASAGQDGDGFGVFGQVFRRNGLSAGPEFQINEVSQGAQRTPSVGIDAIGRFVVAWVEESSGVWKVKARRYAAFGQECTVGVTPLSPEITVAQRPPSASTIWRMASVGVAPDGRFSVAWIDPYYPGDDELKFRLYDGQDVPQPITAAILAPRYHTNVGGIISDP